MGMTDRNLHQITIDSPKRVQSCLHCVFAYCEGSRNCPILTGMIDTERYYHASRMIYKMVGKYGISGTERKLQAARTLIVSFADRHPFQQSQLPDIMRAIEKVEEIEKNEGI